MKNKPKTSARNPQTDAALSGEHDQFIRALEPEKITSVQAAFAMLPDEPLLQAASFQLPDEFSSSVSGAADELDQAMIRSHREDEAFRQQLLHHQHSSTKHVWESVHLTDIKIGWPSSLYIPAGADWKKYWFLPPPDEQRYALQWTSGASGYAQASKEEGSLYSYQYMDTVSRYARTEAGLGVLFAPKRTLSVVSMQPQLSCAGNYRWYQMMDQPVAGYVRVVTSLLLAVWQQIPGPAAWDLVNFRQFAVADSGPHSGSGFFPVASFQRSFSGAELATPFLVQSGRVYLFGVVARTSIFSTLTDSAGRPLPPASGDKFRVWGAMSCAVPQIEIHEQQVHIA